MGYEAFAQKPVLISAEGPLIQENEQPLDRLYDLIQSCTEHLEGFTVYSPGYQQQMSGDQLAELLGNRRETLAVIKSRYGDNNEFAEADEFEPGPLDLLGLDTVVEYMTAKLVYDRMMNTRPHFDHLAQSLEYPPEDVEAVKTAYDDLLKSIDQQMDTATDPVLTTRIERFVQVIGNSPLEETPFAVIVENLQVENDAFALMTPYQQLLEYYKIFYNDPQGVELNKLQAEALHLTDTTALDSEIAIFIKGLGMDRVAVAGAYLDIDPTLRALVDAVNTDYFRSHSEDPDTQGYISFMYPDGVLPADDILAPEDVHNAITALENFIQGTASNINWQPVDKVGFSAFALARNHRFIEQIPVTAEGSITIESIDSPSALPTAPGFTLTENPGQLPGTSIEPVPIPIESAPIHDTIGTNILLFGGGGLITLTCIFLYIQNAIRRRHRVKY